MEGNIMKISLLDSKVELAARQVLRLTDAAGVRVVCLRGGVWLTQNDDLRDLILRAGESFTLDRDGVALVSAMEPGTVRLEKPSLLKAPGTKILAALGAVFRRLARAITGSVAAPSHHPGIALRCY